uniref:Ig-like domain-containing protein n=1 Tax=Podarcis muralis TaxID=64176 RepID=A0A670HSV8_PODMU
QTPVSGVKVTQHPPLANKPEGETVELSCNVDVDNYQFYWYQQRPGHTNLKQLGVIKPFTISEGDTLEEKPGGEIDSRLSGKRDGRTANLILKGLQLNDTGLYLCASKDTVTVGLGQPSSGCSLPTVHLLGPVCHKDHVTLVCVAQGFPYEWPIDVSWKRDAQEVTRLSFATDPVRTLNGTCNFGVSSRLSMTAAEWQERHVYSCHVRQGNIAEAEESMEREPSQQPGKQGLGWRQLHVPGWRSYIMGEVARRCPLPLGGQR